MERALCVSVRYLMGRYHGQEWPPSPARLFQAIVAGNRMGRPAGMWADSDTGALKWLECRAAPQILAPAARRGTPYRHYVPNNDGDLVGRGRKTLAEIRTAKDVAPYVVGEPGGDGVIHYLWPVPETDIPVAERVCALVRHVICLGWGIDPVTAFGAILKPDEARALAGVRWTPRDNGGRSLTIPLQGYLDALDQCHSRRMTRLRGDVVDTGTFPTEYGRQGYVSSEIRAGRAWQTFDLLKPDGAARLRVPWREMCKAAAWARHAAGETLGKIGRSPEWLTRFVYGHNPEDPGQRLSYVPLPSIGHEHSDGDVRRLMVVEPPGSDGETCRLLSLILNGQQLVDEEKGSCGFLRTLTGDPLSKRFTGEARTWLSVSPVVLHGHDQVRGKVKLGRMERFLLEAFAKGGYDASEIADIAAQQAPYWSGIGAAREYRLPRHMANLPRYHVRVTFNHPVRGPVLAGLGRGSGLGVFAAAE